MVAAISSASPDGTLFSQLQNAERRYDLQDALGSIVNLGTDTGGSAGDFKYDPWGRVSESSTGSSTTPAP